MAHDTGGPQFPNQLYGWVQEDDGTWSLYSPDGTRVASSRNDRLQVSEPETDFDVANKKYGDDNWGGGGSQPVKQASVTLDAAQVLAIADAPVILVEGVAGYVINPIGFTAAYIAGETPYTDDSSGLSLYIDPNGGGWSVDDGILMAGVWDQSVDTFMVEALTKVGIATSADNSNTTSDFAGQDLGVICNANPADGDGSLILTVTYVLLPVAA